MPSLSSTHNLSGHQQPLFELECNNVENIGPNAAAKAAIAAAEAAIAAAEAAAATAQHDILESENEDPGEPVEDTNSRLWSKTETDELLRIYQSLGETKVNAAVAYAESSKNQGRQVPRKYYTIKCKLYKLLPSRRYHQCCGFG